MLWDICLFMFILSMCMVNCSCCTKLFKNTQNTWLRILDIISIEYILKLSINSSWHLIPPLAITKAGLICLVWSQQLCSGTMHIRLASKFYSYGNRSKSFKLQNQKIVSRSLVPLYHSTAEQICGAGCGWETSKI